jgi:cardiolipin synthase
MIVDGKVMCFGTANMDIRSFKLNFEVNVIIYDGEASKKMEQIFISDLKKCSEITSHVYARRKIIVRVKEQFCRLLSPLM